MRKFFVSAIAISALLSASASALTAKQSIAKEVKTSDASGNIVVTYEAANLVVPGETVVYQLDYENDGSEPVTNMVLTMPIPSEILYQEGSDRKDGARTVYSVDNAQTFAARNRLTVSGTGQNTKAAEASDITHIRWVFETSLQPGERGQLSFKGTLK